MLKKRAARAGGGWVLAEVLCCAAIISSIAVCVTETVGMMAKISGWIHDHRSGTVDFRSLVGEADGSDESGELSRGVWLARVDRSAHKSGMKFAEVSVASLRDGEPDEIRWISWEITGRGGR